MPEINKVHAMRDAKGKLVAVQPTDAVEAWEYGGTVYATRQEADDAKLTALVEGELVYATGWLADVLHQLWEVNIGWDDKEPAEIAADVCRDVFPIHGTQTGSGVGFLEAFDCALTNWRKLERLRAKASA